MDMYTVCSIYISLTIMYNILCMFLLITQLYITLLLMPIKARLTVNQDYETKTQVIAKTK